MNWNELAVAETATHHVRDGEPAYADRFDEVLKFHPPGLAPVRRAGEAWHIHADGRPAYERRFRRTFGFYEGLAAVAADDGWHHIDPTGADVYPQRFSWCGNFQGGRCTVRAHDGRYHHIRSTGEPAYDNRWRYAGDFRDGVAVVQAEDGRSTHIDLAGRLIHGRWFIDLDVFHKAFARARDEAGWMHVDTSGKPIYARRFAAVEPFYNGQARVERLDGGLEVIDESGLQLVEVRAALRTEFAALSADLVGFWRTETIAAAVELGVFEALPGSVGEIAGRCGLRPERVFRLLRGLGELSLVEAAGTAWQTTLRGEYLRGDHPLTLAGAASEYARHFSPMWKALPEAIRANGEWRAPDVFGDVARDETRRGPHHRMLLSYARHDYATLPAALDLGGDERVVDAGGGLGALAAAMVREQPGLQVVVLDRPEVIEQARAAIPSNLDVKLLAGDLFADWGLRADAVVLARVLHDWCDTDALRILRRARAALDAGGLLFVVEMVLPKDAIAGALCDLHLLTVTGGQERTAAEYGTLFAQTGFELTEVRRLAALPSVLVGVAR